MSFTRFCKYLAVAALCLISACDKLRLQTVDGRLWLQKHQSESFDEYRLWRPRVWSEEQVFVLTYTGEGRVQLFHGEDMIDYALPSAVSHSFRRELILPEENGLSSFRVSNTLQVKELRVLPSRAREVSLDEDFLYIGAQWQVTALSPLQLQLPPDSYVVEVDYHSREKKNPSFATDIGTFTLHPQTGQFFLSFLRSPQHLLLDIHSFDFFHLRTQALSSFPQALSMDVTQMLDMAPEFWRNKDWEWYRWSQYPGIHILLSRNYDIQSRFFSRLAFFAEKEGFRGRILDNDELATRHGWNAHNYHPDDVAAFFTLADPLLLHPEEEELRILLEKEGLIRRQGEVYEPGTGGVIAFAWEGSEILRRLLLHHEAMHGIYYSDATFRTLVWQEWEGYPSEVQEFWRFVMSILSYDGQHTPLVVNELQAYLLQQKREETIDYLHVLRDRLLTYRPASRAYILEAFSVALPWFIDTAERLADYLQLQANMAVGNLSWWEVSE